MLRPSEQPIREAKAALVEAPFLLKETDAVDPIYGRQVVSCDRIDLPVDVGIVDAGDVQRVQRAVLWLTVGLMTV